jgi:hypothetical protein
MFNAVNFNEKSAATVEKIYGFNRKINKKIIEFRNNPKRRIKNATFRTARSSF